MLTEQEADRLQLATDLQQTHLPTICLKAADEIKFLNRALQNIMQVLGPNVPDMDYRVTENAMGLVAEMKMALQLLREAGIEYKIRGT